MAVRPTRCAPRASVVTARVPRSRRPKVRRTFASLVEPFERAARRSPLRQSTRVRSGATRATACGSGAAVAVRAVAFLPVRRRETVGQTYLVARVARPVVKQQTAVFVSARRVAPALARRQVAPRVGTVVAAAATRARSAAARYAVVARVARPPSPVVDGRRCAEQTGCAGAAATVARFVGGSGG